MLSGCGLWGISIGILCRICDGFHVADRRAWSGLSGADGIDSSRRDLGNRSCNRTPFGIRKIARGSLSSMFSEVDPSPINCK